MQSIMSAIGISRVCQAFQKMDACFYDEKRIRSIDILRGIVILLMILDHVRDFFSPTPFNVLNLARTTPAFFLTRFVTHFCAPVFVFLAGASAFLSKRPKKDLSLFLLTRGIFLVILEIVLITPSFGFIFYLKLYFLQVIWAIGWSMIFLAGLVWLPRYLIFIISLLLIAGHNLFDGIQPVDMGSFSSLWIILHVPFKVLSRFLVYYPLIPWIGVIGIGYIFGPVFEWEPVHRKRFCITLGLALLATFVLLRVFNLYGDSQPWSVQSRGLVFTVFSFFNTTKYPPSLSFLLMTLGPAIAFVPVCESLKGILAKLFYIFGRVPLFVYMIHLPVAHLVAIVFSLIMYQKAFWWFGNPAGFPSNYTPNLMITYAVWLILIVLFIPLVIWFAGVKRRSKKWWLSYI